MHLKISPNDYVNYKTDDGKCSRCRKEIREDEVPLRLWSLLDPNIMMTYCESCNEEVLK